MSHLRLVRPETPSAIFRQSFPEGLQHEIVRRIQMCYTLADEHCAQDDEGTRRDHLAIERRRLIEGAMRTIPVHGDFGYVTVQARSNATKSSHHVVLSSGAAAVTFSKTDSPDELPRSSNFRNNYASTLQLDLFGENLRLAETMADEDIGRTYAVICHGPEEGSPRLGFVLAQFPGPIPGTISGPPVDLLQEYMAHISTRRPAAVRVNAVAPTLKAVPRADESGGK